MRTRSVTLLFFVLIFLNPLWARSENQFRVTFPAAAHAGPITGRVYMIVSRKEKASLLEDVGSWQEQTAFFATDINALQPGKPATIDENAIGYPLASLKELPTGEYYVQALVNVYTEFHRSDGHVIWAHMDQWEGQQFSKSPGNLYSKVEKVQLDPAHPQTIELETLNVIPPVEVPPDTEWVKHVKLQSKLLSQFWGRRFSLARRCCCPKATTIAYRQNIRSFTSKDISACVRRYLCRWILRPPGTSALSFDTRHSRRGAAIIFRA